MGILFFKWGGVEWDGWHSEEIVWLLCESTRKGYVVIATYGRVGLVLGTNRVIECNVKHFTLHSMIIMWTADMRMKRRCDHRSCNYDLSNRKLSPKNVFVASTRFEPMASALALQCPINWAMKTHTLGAGQFIDFIVPVKEMKHMIIIITRFISFNSVVKLNLSIRIISV